MGEAILPAAARELMALWEAQAAALDAALEAGLGAPEPWVGLELGDALRRLRRRVRLKQGQLALMIGARQPAVSKIERGADLRLSTLRRLFDALGCDLVLLPRPRTHPKGLEAAAQVEYRRRRALGRDKYMRNDLFRGRSETI